MECETSAKILRVLSNPLRYNYYKRKVISAPLFSYPAGAQDACAIAGR